MKSRNFAKLKTFHKIKMLQHSHWPKKVNMSLTNNVQFKLVAKLESFIKMKRFSEL